MGGGCPHLYLHIDLAICKALGLNLAQLHTQVVRNLSGKRLRWTVPRGAVCVLCRLPADTPPGPYVADLTPARWRLTEFADPEKSRSRLSEAGLAFEVRAL